MKKIYMLALTFMVLLSMTMSVEALEQKIVYRQNGIAAYADWTETTTEGIITDNFLSVTQSNDGTDIYLSICNLDLTSNWLCKSGYMFTTDNVFSMDRKLDSASLKAVQLELHEWSCDETGCLETPAGTATIEAAWTGTGDVSKGSYKWTSKYGDYMAKGSDSSLIRKATATGLLNNVDLGTSDSAGLARFKSVYMEMKK